ncbi:MAG: DNA-binding protein [Bacteroidaceae bacterium]|nr:DNA-binding protein [Bacteroidaceae bacterium]
MALKIKARERLFKVGKFAGTYRYVMQPDLYSALTQEKVIREAALRSGVSEGVMHACWDAAGEVIEAWATEGHSVALPGLGTMRFSLSAKSVADVNDVKSSLIKTRRIVFTPSVELKEELKSTSVIITCYDRNGDIVKRVTSTDDGTIEDNSGEDTTGENDGGNTPSGGDSQNQGGTQGGNTSQGGDEGGDEPFDGGN